MKICHTNRVLVNRDDTLTVVYQIACKLNLDLFNICILQKWCVSHSLDTFWMICCLFMKSSDSFIMQILIWKYQSGNVACLMLTSDFTQNFCKQIISLCQYNSNTLVYWSCDIVSCVSKLTLKRNIIQKPLFIEIVDYYNFPFSSSWYFAICKVKTTLT